MKNLILYTTLSLLFISCNKLSKEEQEFDTLMQEVIDVHDEVMPKMSEISSLIGELESKIDTTVTGQAYAAAQSELKESHDFMMEWMSDFSDKFPHGEEVKNEDKEKFAAKMKMLKEEQIEVNLMRDQVNTSLANAKAILKKE